MIINFVSGLAVLLCLSAASAGAASVTYTDYSFKNSGGDASYGNGDTTTNPYATLGIPFFDPNLGTLNGVDFTFAGWRSLDLTCTKGAAGFGNCSARIDALFTLYAGNNTQLAQINPLIATFQTYTPEPGASIGDTLYATASNSSTLTDQTTLALLTQDGSQDNLWMSFYGNDGGYFGYGGTAGFSSLEWDADASLTLTYNYTPTVVPVPAAAWLFGSALLGLIGIARRKKA